MSTLRQIRDALVARQDALAAATESMTHDELVAPSYCRDWNIAQVLSHLGSASQIFAMNLDAGIANTEAPGQEAMASIWEEWNAKTPDDMRDDALTSGAAFLEHVDSIPPAQLASMQMKLFGMDIDSPRLIGMRLAENAVHTWDILVMSDPSAVIAADAVDDMIDHLDMIAGYTGKTDGGPMEVEVATTAPIRFFRLSVTDSVKLSPSISDHATARVQMPSEAFVRLVYGRLDPDHTPEAIEAEGIHLDALRAVFPGV